MRDSFIFYRSFREATSPLSKEDKADLFEAICQFALEQEIIELSPIAKAMFGLIKPQLEANYKKYLNGKIPKEKQSESKTEAKDKQSESKSEGNVNDNDNVNDNNISKEIQQVEIEEYGNKDINDVIKIINKRVNVYGLVYDRTEERNFAKHFLSNKFEEEIVNQMGHPRDKCIELLTKFACIPKFKNGTENFRHGKVTGPKGLYKNRVKLLNDFITKSKQKG